MTRVYDDISHYRQPYLAVRLGGEQREAEAFGVYITSGPVDARPLSVHAGFGVYAQRLRPTARLARGFAYGGARPKPHSEDGCPVPGACAGFGSYVDADPAPLPTS